MTERAAKSHASLEPATSSARNSRPPVPADFAAQPFLEMQQAFGNQAVQRMLRAHLIQTKLTVNQPGDEYEREADAVADQVMRMADPPSLQRRCTACEQEETMHRKCAECEEEEKLHRQEVGPGPDSAPPIVDEVLRSPGRPLDSEARAFLEPRFGYDFAQVRVHTDAEAATSARSVNAAAYTVGQHIVFGQGQYSPNTSTGQRLLAHELTHTIQQASATKAIGSVGNVVQPSGAQSRSGGNLLLQRQCVPTPACPLLNVPLDAVFPRWEAAEKCLQEDYRRNHPVAVIGFNKEWFYFTGRRPPEQLDIDCFKLHFVAKSGMRTAEPDIFDFTATSIMEITTPSGTPERVVRLGLEVGLANSLAKMTSYGCSGRTWFPGTWSPSPCYWLGGDLYLRAWNTGGILVYQIIKDVGKEAVATAAMAALYKVMKSQGPKAAGRRFAPGYAVAALIATGVTLASGKAEAKAGPGGEDPIITMFKALSAKGTKIPPEMQEALQAYLEANPDVKSKIEKAMRSGDDSAVQEELNQQVLKIINEHQDEFSEEDIVALLTATESAGHGKGADVTAEALRKNLTDLREGRTHKGAGQGREGQKGEGQKGEGQGEPAKPGAHPGSGRYAGISAASRERLQEASEPVQRLFDAMVDKVGAGPRVTNESVDRFLAIVGPTALGPAEANEIIARLAPGEAATVDDALSGLEQAIQQIRAGEKKAEALAKDLLASAGPAALPADPAKAVEATELIILARTADVSNLNMGESHFYLPDPLAEGAEIHTTHIARAPSGAIAGSATIRVIAFTSTTVQILFVSSTDMYDGNGNVVHSSKELVGKTFEARRIRMGTKKKK
jgi:Domain of unknown function (DUF4157)